MHNIMEEKKIYLKPCMFCLKSKVSPILFSETFFLIQKAQLECTVNLGTIIYF